VDIGFLFCRVMRFYSQGYQETLDLPLRTFWMMSGNVNRLGAEEDIRSLSVHAAAGSDKGFKETLERLQREMGEILIQRQSAVARKGLSKLKEISDQQKGKKAK